MRCLTDDEMLKFVTSPMTSESASCAAHIFTCPKCSQLFAEVIDVVTSTQNVPLTTVELKKVSVYLSYLRAKEKFFDRIETLLAQIGSKAKSFVEIVENVITSPANDLQPAFNFRSCGTPSENYVQLVFEANVDSQNSDYWTASVRIPLEVKDGERIKIHCKDYKNNAIVMGRLQIFGTTLAIENGMSVISIDAIRKNLRESKVVLMRETKRVISGHLKFA